MAKLKSSRFPGIMTSLVTSSSLAPLDSLRNDHVTSGTRTGVERGTGERRTLLGVGSFVVDIPYDKQLHVRQSLWDYQEQHRGVVKPQMNQLPEIPFRLSILRGGEGNGNDEKQKADGVIGQLLPLPQRAASGDQSYPTSSSPSLLSGDSVVVENEAEMRLESGGCFPSLQRGADTRKIVESCQTIGDSANVLTGEGASVSQEREEGLAHAQRRNLAADRCAEERPPMAQKEVSELERLPKLQTNHTNRSLNCSLTTGLTRKLSLDKETTRLKPSLLFEGSGPTSKHHVMETQTRLLGDLIQVDKMAGVCEAKQTSQVAAGYPKAPRIPRMGVERSAPVSPRSVLACKEEGRKWIDLVNIQLVDYDEYDRYASRRRPSVSRTNRCREKLYFPSICVVGADRSFLQSYGEGQELGEGVGQELGERVAQELGKGVGQEWDEEVGQKMDKGTGQELSEGAGQELGEGVGQELDVKVGQELDEGESSREMVQTSLGKYSSKSRAEDCCKGLT